MTCIVGIDPGVSGAVAFYFPNDPSRVIAEDIPVAGDNIAGGLFFDLLSRMKPDVAVIELVGAMPGQGVSSMFKFGRAFGTAIGVIQAASIPLHFVTPAKWKRHFNLSADKEAARELALRMFTKTPEHFALKRHHGRAEAALLALYASQVILTKEAA